MEPGWNKIVKIIIPQKKKKKNKTKEKKKKKTHNPLCDIKLILRTISTFTMR